MKTSVADPWSNGTEISNNSEVNGNNDAQFEDSFVNERLDPARLSDSEQYLARLYSRLKHVKGGTSKKDLINSLSNAKEDCIARLVTNGQFFESEEEAMLAANPVIRHIAPHLQALTASELVHLLKADVLQTVTDEQNGQVEAEKSQIEKSQTEQVDPKTPETEQTPVDKLETEPTQAKPSDPEISETENASSAPDANKGETQPDHVAQKENEKQ